MSTYTNEQIRGAILRAAVGFERNPQLWAWGNCYVPPCGTPGCALGHIGAQLGIVPGESLQSLHEVLSVHRSGEFYSRMDTCGDFAWHLSASAAAKALRAYADKYHPASAPIVAEDRQIVPWSQCVWKPASVGARA